MNLRLTALSALVGISLAAFALPSNACFTVIVGKKVSSTGEILVGHNEDNEMRIITSQYWVDPAMHEDGELIEFEPAAAKIPQVKKTLGFWWSQTLAPTGYSFSDGFVNEKGVVVVSNNCNQTIEKGEKINEGGIGYGIRRLIAERAVSARDGVNLAIDLVKKYGYFQEGRTYTIADANEAWQLVLLRGSRYVARKVQDDEIAFLANAINITNIDLKDTANVIASPDLIENAIKKGTYKPKDPKNFSDFNLRKAYQLDERTSADWTKERVRVLLNYLTGKDFKDEHAFPMSMKLKNKVSAEQVRQMISGHSKHEVRDSGWYHQGMNDICNIGTYDSVVYVLRPNPLFTLAWRTNGRPSQQFYYPQYPLAGAAIGQNFMDPKTATTAQFHATPEQLSYRADRPLYTFLAMQNFLDWQHQDYPIFAKNKRAFEKQAAAEVQKADKEARMLYRVDPGKAKAFLHEFNNYSFHNVLHATEQELHELHHLPIIINSKELSQSSDGTFTVTALSTPQVHMTRVDKEATRFGSPFSNADLEVNRKMPKPLKVEFMDVNKDGLKDAVFTFPIKTAVAFTVPDVDTELYLWTKVGKKQLAGYDIVKIKK